MSWCSVTTQTNALLRRSKRLKANDGRYSGLLENVQSNNKQSSSENDTNDDDDDDDSSVEDDNNITDKKISI